MNVGELKAALNDVPDEAEVYVDDEALADEDGTIPELAGCEVDEDGDVILTVDWPRSVE